MASGGGVADRMSITPPAALPYSDDALPRSTSTRAAPSTSSTSTGVWPSGSVTGTPSCSTRTPRTPNAERAPKPRMLTRGSCAGFCRLANATPGIAKSSAPRPAGVARRKGIGATLVIAYGSSSAGRAPRALPSRSRAAAGRGARAWCPARRARGAREGPEREETSGVSCMVGKLRPDRGRRWLSMSLGCARTFSTGDTGDETATATGDTGKTSCIEPVDRPLHPVPEPRARGS